MKKNQIKTPEEPFHLNQAINEEKPKLLEE
jgi:hypothetical protein